MHAPPFIGLPEGMEIGSQRAARNLANTCASATSLYLNPSGGEQHGTLFLGSVAMRELHVCVIVDTIRDACGLALLQTPRMDEVKPSWQCRSN